MNYIHTPNLPQNKISGVLVDYRTPEIALNKLKNENISIYKSARCGALYDAVKGHSDMTITHIIDDIFVCESDCYSYYKDLLCNAQIICGKTTITSTYPYDIAYNVARVGDLAFHNSKYTDKIILEYFEKYNIKLINVKQGYSKCSICVVNENSIITSDKDIADKAYKNNLDVLLINPGYIKLPGFEYGFIGGCSGKISKNELAICGNLKYHADYLKIEDFCGKRNIDIVMLSDNEPIDIGTIIPLYY